MSLERFHAAQSDAHAGYSSALAEIRAGRKRSHWIWYVFPQLYGLGTSGHARAYGIHGVPEAKEYLRDPVLRTRLLEISTAVAVPLGAGVPIETVMGSSIDALKLVSSLTLFGGVARQLARDEGGEGYDALAAIAEVVLEAAARGGYPPCERTAAELNQTR